MMRNYAILMPLALVACAPTALPQRQPIDAIAIGQQVLAAERALEQRAQQDGEWTAFRATAAPGARLLIGEPVAASTWLNGRADPPQSSRWQPSRVVVSCDGTMAATTGNAQNDGTINTVFATIWVRQSTGEWRWLAYDSGSVEQRVPAPTPVTPLVELAECPGSEGPPPQNQADRNGNQGGSRDNTLLWDWQQDPVPGLRVTIWIGPRYAPSITPAARQRR
jgi:hypothetical protein